VNTTSGTTPVAEYRDLEGQRAQLASSRLVDSSWEAEAVQAALALKDVPEDWDRSRSRKPTISAINAALEHIGHVARLGFYALPVPFVAPMSDGGVQLEWDHGGRHVEIELLPDGTARYLTAEAGKISEGEPGAFRTPDLKSLFGWLAATP
jgi:hypothetical protein